MDCDLTHVVDHRLPRGIALFRSLICPSSAIAGDKLFIAYSRSAIAGTIRQTRIVLHLFVFVTRNFRSLPPDFFRRRKFRRDLSISFRKCRLPKTSSRIFSETSTSENDFRSVFGNRNFQRSPPGSLWKLKLPKTSFDFFREVRTSEEIDPDLSGSADFQRNRRGSFPKLQLPKTISDLSLEPGTSEACRQDLFGSFNFRRMREFIDRKIELP
jgi:hypothetical protein